MVNFKFLFGFFQLYLNCNIFIDFIVFSELLLLFQSPSSFKILLLLVVLVTYYFYFFLYYSTFQISQNLSNQVLWYYYFLNLSDFDFKFFVVWWIYSKILLLFLYCLSWICESYHSSYFYYVYPNFSIFFFNCLGISFTSFLIFLHVSHVFHFLVLGTIN